MENRNEQRECRAPPLGFFISSIHTPEFGHFLGIRMSRIHPTAGPLYGQLSIGRTSGPINRIGILQIALNLMNCPLA